MKLTKCVNGHFYDEEKFETCPHCAGTSKLNPSSIFGQSSVPKPVTGVAPEENDDVTVPLEWEPVAAEAAADKPGFAVPPEEPEFVETPKEAGFTAPPEEPEFAETLKETGFMAPPEEPEFVEASKETGFMAPPEEPEFVEKPEETGFTAPPEEPEFSPAPKAVSVDAEPAFDIDAQPSFDTPLDFDSDFAASPVAQEMDSEEEAKEEEEGFELLSKYSSDTPAEESQEAIESVVNPAQEEQPAEIAEETKADSMNGLLSENEMTGNTAGPEFSTEPEAPAFSAAPVNPAFSVEPEAPTFSNEPVNPAFVPEQPAAFDLPSDEDDDDDGHTVAFYDDIFNEVSKTAIAAGPANAVEAPAATSAPDAFAEAANAAAEVAMNAMSATDAANTAEEPNVFTAPPLPQVQTLPTPCVGWLIALNGAHIGQDFHLRVGKNYVGRDESMDVALTGDKSVSRNKHAIIIYEPKHHKYFVQPGESNELIYVNDEVVLLPMELKPYDLLVIGDIELWFMPLCDAEHNWSEVIRKLQEQMQQ